MILGPDLVWRDGQFVTVRAANRDPEFRNPKAVPDSRFDVLVRHLYKVLLTRGMVGTVIYSTDPETRDALRSMIPDRDAERPAVDFHLQQVDSESAP